MTILTTFTKLGFLLNASPRKHKLKMKVNDKSIKIHNIFMMIVKHGEWKAATKSIPCSTMSSLSMYTHCTIKRMHNAKCHPTKQTITSPPKNFPLAIKIPQNKCLFLFFNPKLFLFIPTSPIPTTTKRSMLKSESHVVSVVKFHWTLRYSLRYKKNQPNPCFQLAWIYNIAAFSQSQTRTHTQITPHSFNIHINSTKHREQLSLSFLLFTLYRPSAVFYDRAVRGRDDDVDLDTKPVRWWDHVCWFRFFYEIPEIRWISLFLFLPSSQK